MKQGESGQGSFRGNASQGSNTQYDSFRQMVSGVESLTSFKNFKQELLEIKTHLKNKLMILGEWIEEKQSWRLKRKNRDIKWLNLIEV